MTTINDSETSERLPSQTRAAACPTYAWCEVDHARDEDDFEAGWHQKRLEIAGIRTQLITDGEDGPRVSWIDMIDWTFNPSETNDLRRISEAFAAIRIEFERFVTEVARVNGEAFREKLENNRAEIERLHAEQRELFDSARTIFCESGIDAHVVKCTSFTADVDAGRLLETFETWNGRLHREVTFHAGKGWIREPGIVADKSRLIIDRGTYEVMFKDGDELLVVATNEHRDEGARRREIARLRTAARAEGMRVSVTDLEVSLISPIDNTVVHRGDAESAFKWLFGALEVKAEWLETPGTGRI